jgi:hypothetical protein
MYGFARDGKTVLAKMRHLAQMYVRDHQHIFAYPENRPALVQYKILVVDGDG